VVRGCDLRVGGVGDLRVWGEGGSVVGVGAVVVSCRALGCPATVSGLS